MTISNAPQQPMLRSLRVLEVAGPLAAAVCGRMFAELGADTIRVELEGVDPPPAERELDVDGLRLALDADKRTVVASRDEFARLVSDADLVIVAGRPAELTRQGLHPDALRAMSQRAVIAAIAPFGLTGPLRDFRGSDLVTFHASGMARLLLGAVDDPEVEPPVRAAGGQSAFIAGVAAATGAMHALYRQRTTGRGELVDVSTQEALATMAARELALPAYGKPASARRRQPGTLRATYMLPAADGYVGISPREAHQWRAWVEVMGQPAWAADPRFADRASRSEHGDELLGLMGAWSMERGKHAVAAAAQAAHIPCFPLETPGDVLDSAQLRHRRFFRSVRRAGGGDVLIPGPPYGLPAGDYAAAADGGVDAPAGEWRPRPQLAQPPPSTSSEAEPPLRGVRVVDLSWVIAGPTCTRYLAAMGAEVVKIESTERPDPGRGSELHSVLGQSKVALSLNLKVPEAVEVAKRLIASSDVVVENFATGVMERFGLGYDDLRAIRPDIVLMSTSGLGRTGPEAETVAYGTLVQCYTGFATLNGFPDRPPTAGFAWSDPLCGLAMAFAVVAALQRRRESGEGRHIDFSMAEALLTTMPGPLLRFQAGGSTEGPAGNDSAVFAPHGVYRCDGDDRWLALAVTTAGEWAALCDAIPPLAGLRTLDEAARRGRRAEIDAMIEAWARPRDAGEAMRQLQAAGVPAASSLSSADLFADEHLRDRGFYRPVRGADGRERHLPSLPWRAWDGALVPSSAAPELGANTDDVLRDMLGLSADEVAALREAGALA